MHKMKVKVTEQVLRSLKVARVFRDYSGKITALDFTPNGERLVSCGMDDQIVVYDCVNGTQLLKANTTKYGVELIRFSHAQNSVIHTSRKIDNTIRFLSLHDNKYLRNFQGHADKVTSLCVSPLDDTFISGSVDKTLRLWDLRSADCQAVLTLPGPVVAAYDPQGLIFAVGANSDSIRLYDVRNFDRGPFAKFVFKHDDPEWTGLKFARDGKTMLTSSDGSVMRLIDAYHGNPLQTFKAEANNLRIPIEASYSPDSKFICSGSSDGRIHMWNADTAYKVCELNGNHPAPVQCVQFNPKTMMLASACYNLGFWLPTTV